jgi:hypothetical protein
MKKDLDALHRPIDECVQVPLGQRAWLPTFAPARRSRERIIAIAFLRSIVAAVRSTGAENPHATIVAYPPP